MDPSQLETLIDEEKNLFFLDVRTPEEVATLGTLPGYINIPIDQLEQRLGEIPRAKPIVTAWNRGGRAARAAALLISHGFKVKGSCGLADWKDAGKEVFFPVRGKTDRQ